MLLFEVEMEYLRIRLNNVLIMMARNWLTRLLRFKFEKDIIKNTCIQTETKVQARIQTFNSNPA